MALRAAGRPRKLTHARIVEAAIQVLDEEGFAALSARSLAQRLGVNHATLYNYVRHIEDIEAEALGRLIARVPIPSRDNPAPMRAQLTEHLLAVREMQLQHPHVLHAPVGSPTWRSHVLNSNRVLRALSPHSGSLFEAVLAYNVLTAVMATSAERNRASGTASHSDYVQAQRRAVAALPRGESELVRRLLLEKSASGPGIESLAEVLNFLIDRLLPGIDRPRKPAPRRKA
ncbi:MAG: TetR/AcrR family transcriptional regulator [Nevskiales bacterium]